MSNHPKCLDCVAVSVCAAKYGQPICIEVHSKVMKFGKLIANSDSREDSKNSPAAPVQQLKDSISLLKVAHDLLKSNCKSVDKTKARTRIYAVIAKLESVYQTLVAIFAF